MKKHKNALKRIFADTTDLSTAVFSGTSEITVIGAYETEIEGCRGILVYENDEIQLRLCDRNLCIKGSGLSMKSYFGTHISVRGAIESISFLEE